MADYFVFATDGLAGQHNLYLQEATGVRIKVQQGKTKVIIGDMEIVDVIDLAMYDNITAANCDLQHRFKKENNHGRQ